MAQWQPQVFLSFATLFTFLPLCNTKNECGSHTHFDLTSSVAVAPFFVNVYGIKKGNRLIIRANLKLCLIESLASNGKLTEI